MFPFLYDSVRENTTIVLDKTRSMTWVRKGEQSISIQRKGEVGGLQDDIVQPITRRYHFKSSRLKAPAKTTNPNKLA
jgi:hypothetical protein